MTIEERIATAYALRQANADLQEEIDDNERQIEELLDVDDVPYDFEEMIALLRKEPTP